MTERMIKSWIAVGVVEGLRMAGVTAGEISERQARKTYGKWFVDEVAAGRIRPIRIGTGKTSTKHYSVTDILTRKAIANTPAELIYK